MFLFDAFQSGDHRTNENHHGKQMNTCGTKTNIEEQAMLSGIPNQQNLVFENEMPESDNLSFSENNKSASLSSSNVYHYYESKVASLIRKNGILEGQLAASLASKEAAEKSLTSVLKSRQEMERKLADAHKEMELMREKLASLELAQEEANNLSNIVHSDNVRLEHDVAFLKAVLDDTQKVRYMHDTSFDWSFCIYGYYYWLTKICCRSCILQEELLPGKEQGHFNYRYIIFGSNSLTSTDRIFCVLYDKSQLMFPFICIRFMLLQCFNRTSLYLFYLCLVLYSMKFFISNRDCNQWKIEHLLHPGNRFMSSDVNVRSSSFHLNIWCVHIFEPLNHTIQVLCFLPLSISRSIEYVNIFIFT